jgi:uncharacterized protein (DUF433 family)
MQTHKTIEAISLGTGFYTVPEASRLLRSSPTNIRRWLAGYTYTYRGELRVQPPLWQPQLPARDDHIELGFRDLIELRFVQSFLKAGLGLRTIRNCLIFARHCVDDERPFSTSRFRTDGKTIFLDFVDRAIAGECPDGDTPLPEGERKKLLDLKKQQYAFRDFIAPTFKDLDLDGDVVSRWRPHHGKPSIIIDPARAFGQPIATSSGVPTASLASAVNAEGSAKRVAYLFKTPASDVRDAVDFENQLSAA